MVMSGAGYSQPWLKTTKGTFLYTTSDHVGIGMDPQAEKVAINSVNGESQIGLYGLKAGGLPFIRAYSNTLASVFSIYASVNSWSFMSLDSSLAPIYVKGTRVIFPGIVSAKGAIQRSWQVVDSAKTTISSGTYLVIVNTGNTRADSISLGSIPLYAEVVVTRNSGSQNVVVYSPSATINGSGNIAITSSGAGKRFFKRSSTVIISY